MSETKKQAGYVAIIGKPNAGKSTLMNAIVGAKLSIVTPKPQTTRKKVLGIFSDANTQIVFLDTPGILKPSYKMHETMMTYVSGAIEESEIIVVLIDLEKYTKFESYFNPAFLAYFQSIQKPKIVLLNKIDIYDTPKKVLPIISEIAEKNIFNEIIPASAVNSANTDGLLEVLKKYLPENEFFFDEELLSTQPERFFVAELIREQIFLKYEKEVPYSIEVSILEFKERQKGKWFISAEIILERVSQKKIFIGEKGKSLKEIGAKSRKAIEAHLGLPVYLELFVKVRDNWRDKSGMLKSFGY